MSNYNGPNRLADCVISRPPLRFVEKQYSPGDRSSSSPPLIQVSSDSETEEPSSKKARCRDDLASGSEMDVVLLDEEDDESGAELEIVGVKKGLKRLKRINSGLKKARKKFKGKRQSKRTFQYHCEIEESGQLGLEVSGRWIGVDQGGPGPRIEMTAARKKEATKAHQQCMDQIEEQCAKCVNEKKTNFIVLVAGPKNVGKSTFCRRQVNCFLTKGLSVYHLECDPGQTEFTPPGCLALTEVTEPVDGLPFTHLRTPARCIFFGETSHANRIEEYLECIRRLISDFSAMTRQKPSCLVVNTSGWINGAGLDALREIVTVAKPTYTVFLDPVSRPLAARAVAADAYRDIRATLAASGAQGAAPCVRISEWTEEPTCSFLHARGRAAAMREAVLFAYFGHWIVKTKQDFTAAAQNVSQCIRRETPYAISAGTVYARVAHAEVPPRCILSVMNASLVALCRLDNAASAKHWMDDPTLPMVLQEPLSNLQCYGFGFIRATDAATRTFYVVTPIPAEKLARVNVLLKGDISLPSSAFLRQNTNSTGVGLPYVARGTVESALNDSSLFRKLFSDDGDAKRRKKTARAGGAKKRTVTG